MLEIGTVLHSCEVATIFAIVCHQGEVLGLVELVAATVQPCPASLVDGVHDRLVVLLWVEALNLIEVEHSGVARRGAERVVQVVELDEQDLVEALLSLRSMAPHSFEVVA